MVEEKVSKLHQFIKPRVVDSKRMYWRSWVVSHLKILFPLFASIPLLFIFIWPSLTPSVSDTPQMVQKKSPPQDLENNSAREMSFTTADKDGNPIEITAQKGIELDLQQVLLTQPILSFRDPNIGLIKMRGTEGIYKPSSKEIILKGNVKINHPEGHQLITSGIIFDLEGNKAYTTAPAIILSPWGKIETPEIELLLTDKKLILKGRPVLTFFKEALGR